MESANKLAATECLRKAEKKFIEEDYNESLRLAKKSSRLCSSQEAEELMEKIQSKMTSGSGGGVPTTEGEDVRQRRQEDQANSSRSDHPPSDACAPAYTPQQQQSVDRVIRCTTFYEVLSVEKEDGVDVVKKSYRRLALQLHPDKNKAPRAAEAFKRVSKAYDTLSDPEKKRMYDQFGEQGLEGAQQGGFHRHYHADDFDADKLFRDFFGFDPFGPGTSFNTTTFYFDDNGGQNIFFQSGPRRRGVHNQHFRNSVRVENRRDSTLMLSYLMFLVPVFLLFVLPVLVEVFSPPEFSLNLSPPYTVKRELQVGDAKLPYYVKTDVNNSPESYRRMEKNVLLSYADRYLQQCHNQRIQKAKAQRMARTAAEVKKANEQKTEDCDLYMQLLNAKI